MEAVIHILRSLSCIRAGVKILSCFDCDLSRDSETYSEWRRSISTRYYHSSFCHTVGTPFQTYSMRFDSFFLITLVYSLDYCSR